MNQQLGFGPIGDGGSAVDSRAARRGGRHTFLGRIHDLRDPLTRGVTTRFGGQPAASLEIVLADSCVAAVNVLAFLDVGAAVLHQSPRPIPGEDRLNASRVLHAVYEVAQRGDCVAVTAQSAPAAGQATRWTSV